MKRDITTYPAYIPRIQKDYKQDYTNEFHKLDKFLEQHKLPVSPQQEMNTMSRPTSVRC